jgi:hypothetical protein
VLLHRLFLCVHVFATPTMPSSASSSKSKRNDIASSFVEHDVRLWLQLPPRYMGSIYQGVYAQLSRHLLKYVCCAQRLDCTAAHCNTSNHIDYECTRWFRGLCMGRLTDIARSLVEWWCHSAIFVPSNHVRASCMKHRMRRRIATCQ